MASDVRDESVLSLYKGTIHILIRFIFLYFLLTFFPKMQILKKYATFFLPSELLGSFGDNELAPECLWAAQPLLTFDGVSIPSSYTSYLAPLHAACLTDICDAKNLQSWWIIGASEICSKTEGGEVEEGEGVTASSDATCVQCISAQPLFTFTHPMLERDLGFDLKRHLEFASCKCERATHASKKFHGLVGYFEATLSASVRISTVPGSRTPGLVEWLPFFFPVSAPFLGPVTVCMTRRSTISRVWYEWSISESHKKRRAVANVHNCDGLHCFIGTC